MGEGLGPIDELSWVVRCPLNLQSALWLDDSMLLYGVHQANSRYSTPDVLRYCMYGVGMYTTNLVLLGPRPLPLPIALRKLLKKECSPFSKKASPGVVVPKPRFGEILHQVSSCQFFFPSCSSVLFLLHLPRELSFVLVPLLLAGFLQTLESPTGSHGFPSRACTK